MAAFSLFGSNAQRRRPPTAVNISAPANNRDKFREIPVKVHVRRPERDSWSYVGRAVVTQEAFGQGSRIGTSLSLMSSLHSFSA